MTPSDKLMNEQNRMGILLAIVPEPGRPVYKNALDGTVFVCLAHHFNGKGLIEISEKPTGDEGSKIYRMSIYGEPFGIFERASGGEVCPIYDRDSATGDLQAADQAAISLLKRLEQTISPEEEMAYFL